MVKKHLKKIAAVSLAIVMTLSMSGCGKDKDAKKEGIGITNIIEAAEKYGAECEFREEDGEFVASILFK